MGGGLKADLTEQAVPVLWSEPPTAAPGWHPVLQVVDVSHVPDGTDVLPAPASAGYHLLLSDGVHSQHATLAPALHHLARGGALRGGSVVRLLSFTRVAGPGPGHARTIFILQLEILQTECALIGSLKYYKPPRNTRVLSISRSDPSDGDRLSSVALLGRTPVWKMVGQIQDEYLGYSEDLISVKATISCVTELLYCVTCPLVVNGRQCNALLSKKQCNAMATGDVGRLWRCDRCGGNFLAPKYECSVRIQIQDHTGTAFAAAYEEAAEEILGCRAKDLYSTKYKGHDHAQVGDIILRTMGKQYMFQLKVERQKCVVLKAEKVNPSAESRRLLGQIDASAGGFGARFRASQPQHA